MEIWKPIIGYEELYEVSSLGRIKHLKKLRYTVPKIMKLSLGRDGKYVNVNLYKEGKYKYIRIHRLVAKAFVNNKKGLPHVLHIDGDPTNNKASNLKWGDDKENQLDRKRHGTDNSGERNGMSKLTKKEVLSIKSLYASGKYTQKKLGLKFGVCTTNISQIVNNKRWNN